MPAIYMNGVRYGNNLVGETQKVLTARLSAGNTNVTFTDDAINANSYVDFYASKPGVNIVDVIETEGSVTVTFEAQTEDVNIKMLIS